MRQLCVFTTHTPVDAGHDRFPWEMVGEVLEELVPLKMLKELGGADELNMTLLGLNLSNFINGVAKKHGEVSQEMFPGYEIHAITNGVHSFTWTCEEFKALYNHYLPGWANEPELFVRVGVIPDEQLWEAHQSAKRRLLGIVAERTGRRLLPRRADLRLRAPRHGLQARRPALLRSGAAAPHRRRAPPGDLRGQGPPEGRARQAAHRGASTASRASSARRSRWSTSRTTTWTWP